MADIRIVNLPLATGGTAPTPSDVVAIDGTTTRKTPLSALADVIRPVATQADAETGTNNVKTMTPLTTTQAIAFQAASASQGAKADTALQPSDIGTTVASAAEGDLAVTALQPSSPIFVPSNLTSSVQAPAIIKANGYRWSLFAFNGGETERAKSTGIADYRTVFESALVTGEKVHLPQWEYPIRSYTTDIDGSINAVTIRTDLPVDVECAMGAKIIGTSTLDPVVGGLFRIITSTDSTLVPETATLRWVGGTIDTSAIPADGAGTTVLDTYWHKFTTIKDVNFYAGFSTPSGDNPGFGGSDTAFCPHRSSNVLFEGNKCFGFPDAAVYLTGNNEDYPLDDLGERYTINNNFFKQCGSAVTFKRDAVEIIVSNNHILKCINGIFGSPADGINNNEGKGVSIIGNRLNKIQGRPIMAVLGVGDIVSGNTVCDFGKLISDNGANYTTVSTFNWIGGIELRGCKSSNVTGNTVGFREWDGVTGAPANREPHGVVIKYHDNSDPDVTATHNIATSNTFRYLFRSFIEGAGADQNYGELNKEFNVVNKPSLQGSGSVYLKPLIKGSVTIDLPAIGAGLGTDVDIPVTGAVLGDGIAEVSFSRSLTTAGGTLDHSEAVHTAGIVRMRVLNSGNAASSDLGNTIITVWVRPA